MLEGLMLQQLQLMIQNNSA